MIVMKKSSLQSALDRDKKVMIVMLNKIVSHRILNFELIPFRFKLVELTGNGLRHGREERWVRQRGGGREGD